MEGENIAGGQGTANDATIEISENEVASLSEVVGDEPRDLVAEQAVRDAEAAAKARAAQLDEADATVAAAETAVGVAERHLEGAHQALEQAQADRAALDQEGE